jgi:hypothetical protein
LVFKLGECFDALGLYFMFRCQIVSWVDLDRLVLGFVILSVPVTLFFIVERVTGRNPFSAFGGVPVITVIREGRLRCQGAFSHPILAGCFWVSVLPLIASRWWVRGGRTSALLGSLCCLTIVLLCASSTPLLMLTASGVATSAFLVRRYMRLVRWGALVAAVFLHMIMEAPVWHLVARMDVLAGSTGWHRYHLVDQAIRHASEWWLVGTESTAHWGWGLQDVTNHYVLEAILGGIGTLLLFLAILGYGFRSVGRAWRKARPDRARVVMSWALGTTLFAQATSFIAVSYFGQIIVAFYFVVAASASMEIALTKRARSVRLAGPRQAMTVSRPVSRAVRWSVERTGVQPHD